MHRFRMRISPQCCKRAGADSRRDAFEPPTWEQFISADSVTEREHGWDRAARSTIAEERRRFLDEGFGRAAGGTIHREMAVRGTKVDANMREACSALATVDLPIGITLLHSGYAMGTRDAHHFRMGPGLKGCSLPLAGRPLPILMEKY